MMWLCPLPISIHKFIHTFAKYNLQISNTNDVPIAVAKAVPFANAAAEALPFASALPTHAQYQCCACCHGCAHCHCHCHCHAWC